MEMKGKREVNIVPTDAALIALFEARDEQAITKTQQAYGGFCYSIAYRILGNAQDAEECVNDAMLCLWNVIPTAKPKSFRAYLITVIKNLALDRAAAAQAGKRGGNAARTSLEALSEVLPATDDTALAAEQRALKAALGRFLAGLPQETRIIFIERYWFMSTVPEIAAEHGMGQSAVKMTLSRTRKKLEKYLKEEELL